MELKEAGQIVSIQQQGIEQTDIETGNKTFMSTQENIERQVQSDAIFK
ncbi:MAG: hypothetical protein MTP17_04270 [Candidatus Midichloria sp.]|nr:MAG: hypothetical protein MTP17_04270 [Candidatus Midichloria sp.]